MNMPGKNPARNTPIGNLLHLGSIRAAEELTPLVVVADGEAVDLVEADVFVADAAEELLVVELPEEEASVFPVLLVPVMMLQTGGPDCD